MKRWIIIGAALLLPSTAALADTPSGEKCFSTESVDDVLKKFSKIKSDKRDTVDTVVTAYFAGLETRTVPTTLYLKDGERRLDFVVSEDGEVQGFADGVRTASAGAELCGTAREDGKLGLGMGTDVTFLETSGRYSLETLRDGLKDGKSHYKASVPGAMAMFVPTLTHVMVSYVPIDTAADIVALVGGAEMPVTVEPFGKVHVVALSALEDMGAEALLVRGGDHTLSPVPSIKKMKSLGFGPDEPDEDDEDDEDDGG